MQPQFSALDKEGQGRYLALWSRCPERSSDYSFVNLYAWHHARNYEWAFEDGLCWLRTNHTDHDLWAPTGPWNDMDWGKVMQERFPEDVFFYRVPEKLALLLNDRFGDKVTLQEQLSEWEYVYSVKELIELSGNRFHKKKNLLRQFTGENDYSYHEITPELISEILEVQKDWCSWKNCDGTPGLKAENEAILRVLAGWADMEGLFGGLLKVRGSIVAYTVAEKVDEENIIIHFEKGMTGYRGVYQAINQIFLERSCSNFLWVNREQDMGNEGLKKAKRSYHPHRMLKKYRLQWKPSI